MRTTRATVVVGFLLASATWPCPAIAAPSGFGLQFGLTYGDPSEETFQLTDVVGGIHYIVPLARHVDFAPSVDVGTGAGALSLSLNANLHVNLAPDAEVGPYVGAGFSSYTAGPSSDTEDMPDAAGPTAIAGVWFNRHGGTSYSFETRFGFSGVSKFTALFAVTF